MPIKFPICGPSYSGPSTSINAQQCVNFIHQVDKSSGKAVLSLIGRYGLDLFSYIGINAIRGGMESGNIAVVVAGNKCYKVANDGTVTEKGTLDTATGRIGIDSNGLEIMIVDGTSGYIYTIATNTFAKIADADFGGGRDVHFNDGYFVVDNIAGTAQVSGVFAGSTWNVLDKATPEADPDGLVRVIPVHGNIWMMGESTIEPWYNANNAEGFPYSKMQGGFIDMGLAALWGACKAGNTLYWLAQNKEGFFGIVRANGYTPEKISTPALDYEIRGYSTILDCEMWSFTDRGHTFIYATFPTANKTWCFDAQTGLWHEVRSWGIGAFRCNCHFFFNQVHILGDRTTGKLYKVNWDTFRDVGDYIEGIRVTQHVDANGLPVEINVLKILMEVGVGPMEESGLEEPMLMMSSSIDVAKTWSDEQWASLGWQGDYLKEVIYTRLGTAENWTLKLRITSPCRRVLMGAVANMNTGED